MGGGPARIYPKANRTAQWWETAFARGTFSRIEKILLHTTETTGWPDYKSGASAPTLTYHPRQRAWRQHNYLDTSARALVDPTNTVVRENRDNVIQIEIICYSDEKIAAQVGGLPVSGLTDAHLGDLADFIAFVRREWGGPPLVSARFPYPNPKNSALRMSGPEYDAFRGVLGHLHASGNDHWDPGALNAPKLLRMVQAIEGGNTPAPAPKPAPTPVPEEDFMASIDDLMGTTFKGADGARFDDVTVATWRNVRALIAQSAAEAGRDAALLSAIKALSSGQPVDLAAVQAAAKAGTEAALKGYQLTLSKEA